MGENYSLSPSFSLMSPVVVWPLGVDIEDDTTEVGEVGESVLDDVLVVVLVELVIGDGKVGAGVTWTTSNGLNTT